MTDISPAGIALNKVYGKIPGPFRRSPSTKEIMPDVWTDMAFEYLARLPWLFQEKIDGMNIRIIWDGHKVSFKGRTNRAQLPGPLTEYLEREFGGPENEELFEQAYGGHPHVFFGEGYGPGIQKGGHYAPEQRFILFDVWRQYGDAGFYLARQELQEHATTIGAHTVPAFEEMSLLDAIEYVGHHPTTRLFEGRTATYSPTLGVPSEGLVGVPAVPLRNIMGSRLIVKVKTANVPDLRPNLDDHIDQLEALDAD